MIFKYKEIDSIPCLAWIAVIKNNSDLVEVIHGSSVECFESFFVAGVWDGDFLSGDFCNSYFPCCTGGILKEGTSNVIFCAPENMQEMIFSIKKDGNIYISNSLPFILEMTKESFDENYYNYEFDFGSGLIGRTKSVKSTPLKSKNKLYIHRCCNVIVDVNLDFYEENRQNTIVFSDYSTYRDHLLITLALIRDNSIDIHRRYKYGMISSVSQGYDATAVAVLAKKIGCDEAFTFNSPQDDAGDAIAQQLGYRTIHSVDPNYYKKSESQIFVESAASGGLGDFVSWGVYEEFFAGKLFFMGHRGDSIWERVHDNVNDDLDFSVGNGIVEASIIPSEFCLRLNTIVISIPWIGASHWSEISSISNSDEMRNYSLREEYDRPIPRRIAEENGIDRYAFGRIKKGAGVSFHFSSWNSLIAKIPSPIMDSMIHFKKGMKQDIVKKNKNMLSFYFSELPFYINAFLRKRMGLKIKRIVSSYRSSPNSILLLLWGINETRKRYILDK